MNEEQIRVIVSAEVKKLKEELDKGKKEVEKFSKTGKKSFSDFNDAMSKAGDVSSKVLKTMAATLTATGAALLALSSSTDEYRTNQTKLKTAFETTGASADEAKQVYRDLFRVLGDDDVSVEAANHLAQLSSNQKDLSEWTNICKGVYASFGDSLPIEGLTEAANETIKNGEVVGVLADALNWAKTANMDFNVEKKKEIEFTKLSTAEYNKLSAAEKLIYDQKKAQAEAIIAYNKSVDEATTAEEKFNIALSNCNTEAEREKVLREFLTAIYGESADVFEENNAEMIKLNESQANYNEKMAALGEAIIPVRTAINNLMAAIGEKLAPIIQDFMDKHGEELNEFFEVLAEKIGAVISWVVDNWGTITAIAGTIAAVSAAMKVLSTITAAVNAVMLASPITWIVAGIAALAAGVVALVANFDELTTEMYGNKAAILELEEAQKQLNDAIEEGIEATDKYVKSVDNAERALKELEEAEKATGLSGKALYDQVQQGTLDYADMNEAQRKVYKAYLENNRAQKDLEKSTEELTAAKKKEALASIENQLALQAESGDYQGLKDSVIDFFNKGIISADEARDALERSMSKMSNSTRKTFSQDIPRDVKEGMDPHKYETQGRKWLNFFDDLWTSISGIFTQEIKMPEIKMPHFKIKPVGWEFGDLLDGIIPKIEIDWYARGGVFDKPTVLSGLGEAGAEAIVPLENNLEWLDKLAGMLNDRLGGNNQPIVLNVDGKRFGEIAYSTINDITRQRGKTPLVLA